MNILIVDSNISLSNQMKKYIISCGNHDITIMNSGKKVRDLVCSTFFDVIFLDLLISEENGLKLLKCIKNSSKCKESYTISTIDEKSSSTRLAVDCMKIGSSDYWTKPFQMKRIKGVI